MVQYRDLFYFLVWRDIKVRYKQTVLGALWAIIQPVMQMIVFSIFFGTLVGIPSDGLPYPVFVYASLLPWMLFASAISHSANSVVSAAHLITKVYFPRLIIPMASIGSALVDFAVASSVLLVLMLYYGVYPGPGFVLIPLLVMGTVVMALGVGLLIAALNVAYRDFRYVVPFMLQLWFFLTPVVYPVSIVPSQWQWLLHLNPMTGLIDGFRAALLNRTFGWMNLAVSCGVAGVTLIIAVIYFLRTERNFADIV
jgi:lipopolysaccharide transport system permease protein